MADLLTVYEDEQANTFIDCTICNKRIMGETQYKVHMTTLQHLKKEEALVAQGAIPRPPPLPQWTDIREYLEYLNLDEPIIGLSSLIQVPDFVSEDGKTVLKYKCRLCIVEMDLFSMVSHIVGRKHRQKYLELRRPDLVTWQDNAQKQPGLVARAKAAVVEKQEGWGKPKPLKRPQNNFRNVYQAGSDSRPAVHEQHYSGRDPHRPSPLVEHIHRQPHLDEDKLGRPSYTREKYDPYVDQGGIRRPPSQEGYEEATLGRRPYSSGDGIRNRFNDKDFRVHDTPQHFGGSEYQDQMERMMYSAYGERGPGVDAVSNYGGSFQDEERRVMIKEFEERTHGYSQRLDPRGIPRAYHEEPGPAKKKRKSRFSDATVEEVVLAQIRHSDKFIHKAGQRPQNQPRGPPIRERPQLFNNPVQHSESTSHFNPNTENILDVLNEIRIENMEDASYLKEKLCTVLKEYQETKTLRAGGHSVSDHRADRQMDQHRDAYPDKLREDPDGRYFENRGFQEVRQYEDSLQNFQGSRRYEDDPRTFQEVRQYEDNSRDPRETRHYEENSRDYREPRQFDRSHSDFPQEDAMQYPDDSRGFQKTRFQENTTGFPERGSFDRDLRGTAGHYQDYSRSSQDGRQHAEGLRGTQEPKYYADDFRGFENMDADRKWDHQKRRSLERYGGPVDERGFQESFGNPPIPFQPHEDTRMYAGRGQHRSHQDVRHNGDELYDPFHPSPSPPPEAPSSTSLNKIASTLLELVARR